MSPTMLVSNHNSHRPLVFHLACTATVHQVSILFYYRTHAPFHLLTDLTVRFFGLPTASEAGGAFLPIPRCTNSTSAADRVNPLSTEYSLITSQNLLGALMPNTMVPYSFLLFLTAAGLATVFESFFLFIGTSLHDQWLLVSTCIAHMVA